MAQTTSAPAPDPPGMNLSLQYGHDTLEALYKRLDKLGEGTFGTVYKAQDLQNNEFVALKRKDLLQYLHLVNKI